MHDTARPLRARSRETFMHRTAGAGRHAASVAKICQVLRAQAINRRSRTRPSAGSRHESESSAISGIVNLVKGSKCLPHGSKALQVRLVADFVTCTQ